MVLFIIYLLGVVIFTTLLSKENELDFLGFENHKLQRFMRVLFVFLIVLTLVTPSLWLFSNELFNEQGPIMKAFCYLGTSALYIIFGIFIGIITLGIIKLLKWIWK